MVIAQGTGSATITASTGNIGGSASVSVAGLTSITLSPTNPTLTTGQGQQITALGTFSDGSSHDVTKLVTWAPSNNTVAVVGNTQGFQGYLMGAASGTATISATLGSLSSNTSVSVQAPIILNPPSVTSAYPSTGQAGSQITLSGASFGSSQGSGQVWLGTTYASVVSWSDGQIVAIVALNASSGVAQVQQNGVWSNTVPFNVNTATVVAASPSSGIPGTTVTINGSGFGASQGSGLVWLGTANGVVQSWSDGQIVAQVAAGSTSGNAQVLQGGVWSNAIPFTVNSLHVTQISPDSGGAGTTVTVSGTGFGASQGSGIVWIGSTNGDVVSWSDTQVVATVDAAALSGVVRVEQNDQWSNAVTFTVPSGGSTLTLNPNMLNLVVGETHTIDAVNPSGQEVTGLTWASSNSQIVSLSQDDPPILRALATGHVTITAGSASADINVYTGPLSQGAVIWSNPGDGSGVVAIVPAVPSSSGVADVFAFNNDGTVSAITGDGTTAWAASLNGADWYQAVPDFQGGLIVPRAESGSSAITSITRLDGTTGQPNPAYTVNSMTDYLSTPVVHTDGTIFTLDYGYNSTSPTISVVGIDPTTGSQKFSVPLDQGKWSNSSSITGRCEDNYSVTKSGTGPPPSVLSGNLIIAGDGYAYVAYEYQDETYVNQITFSHVDCKALNARIDNLTNTDTVTHFALLRVGTDGTSSKIDVKDWDAKYTGQFTQYYCDSGPCDFGPPNDVEVATGAVPTLSGQMITNRDQGTALSWQADTPAYCAAGNYIDCAQQVPASSGYGFATTSGDALASSTATNIPGQATAVQPVLQAQDGSFIGVVGIGPSPGAVTQYNMVAFNQSGSPIWSVPNDYPQIATADGGVVGSSGITYDSQGRATGQVVLSTQSWTASNYELGPSGAVTAVNGLYVQPGGSYWSFANANQSGNETAREQVSATLVQRNSGTVSADNSAGDAYDTAEGTRSLGRVIGTGNIGPGCYLGNEMVGTITPSNYTGHIVLNRRVLSETNWYDSTLFSSEFNIPDTSQPAYRDDDPQSGGSAGKVYDLDAPGFDFAGLQPENFVYRSRINFQAWAALPDGTRISPYYNYYARLSCKNTQVGPVFIYDIKVPPDNQIGPNSTPLSWNLK